MKNVLIGALVLVALAALFIVTRPSEFVIHRARTLAAPPEVVYAYVNDFHKWAEWSPWDKLDPGMKREYSGAAAGVGASYHWIGNDKVGEGSMTITESEPPDKVTIELEFLKPYPAKNTVEFYIDKGGLGTEVEWAMLGHKNFMAKAVGLFMNMDKLVGGDFEKGLADLDAVTAAAAKLAPPAPEPAPPSAPGAD